ncbi:MAG TPA: RNA polymerase sigma factor, partial [Gemmata sp.]|nr:RNA polymerase sigma factor [Gemmata sp.]
MIAGRPSEILRQLEERRTPDRELLARFVRERDQVAFAELVRTHGPVVLGVCRGVTGHPQDAEDAFQAVFLILARKAAAIGNPDLLGNWLYGVAVRVAQKAHRTAARRRVREVAVSAMPDTPIPPDEAVPELNPILDEELAALPSWYRDAIILCDLRGVSREEAAAALGVPEGTLSSRLANGRKKLAARLTKRGIALSTAAIPATLSATQAAVLPTELVTKTCGLVADWMAGGAIPRPLIKLTEGGMTVRKILVLGVLTTVAVVASVVYAAQPVAKPQTTDPSKLSTVAGKSEIAQQPVPNNKPGDKTVTFSSAPKLLRGFDVNLMEISTVLWNAQGTQLAIAGKDLNRQIRMEGAVQQVPTALRIFTLDPFDTFLLRPLNNSKLVGFTP